MYNVCKVRDQNHTKKTLVNKTKPKNNFRHIKCNLANFTFGSHKYMIFTVGEFLLTILVCTHFFNQKGRKVVH